MTREKQVETKHNRVIEGQSITKRYNKAELTKKLQEKNIVIPGNMKNIKHLCVQQGIPTGEKILKVEQGWEGQTKGILQSLWERGFIDINNLNQYTLDGRKDKNGELFLETSLKYVLSYCTDFQEEESLLQTMGWSMGILVDLTLKCHPNLQARASNFLGVLKE